MSGPGIPDSALVGLAADAGCSQGAQLGPWSTGVQDVASSLRGLGLLQHGGRGPGVSIPRTSIPGASNGSCKPSYDLALEVTQCHSLRSVGYTGVAKGVREGHSAVWILGYMIHWGSSLKTRYPMGFGRPDTPIEGRIFESYFHFYGKKRKILCYLFFIKSSWFS